MLHHHAFHLRRNERSSLIQDGVLIKQLNGVGQYGPHREKRLTHLRTMVEQPRPGNLLLIASTQCFPPLPRRVPPSFPLHDVIHLHDSEHREKIVVRYAP